MNWLKGAYFISLEDVKIDDVSTAVGVPSFIKEEDLLISKVGLSLTRDTRNSILFPSEGSIVTIRKEFAGGPFGGDADYGRFEIQGAKFIETFDPMEQVFLLLADQVLWADLMEKMLMSRSLKNSF